MIPIATAARKILGRRGFGYREDGPDLPRSSDIDKLGLSLTSVSSVLLHSLSPVLDQGGTNSCVMQAIADAELNTLTNRHGVSGPQLGSRRYGYWLGRKRDGIHRIDNGSRPSQVLAGLVEHGLPPESQMPWSEWKINDAPPFAALWDARDHRGIRGHYKIYDTGDMRWQAIRSALSSGRAVVFGTVVDQAFVSNTGPSDVRFASMGPTVGRHMMQIVGCSDLDGRWYRVKNSWGVQWRGGYCYLDEEFIENATDLIVIDPESPVK
jgi:hypothetical protein